MYIRWTRISPYKILRVVPPSPQRRYGHTMVAYHNNLYVFGGTAESSVPNDLHRFDLETNTWSIVDVVNNSELPSSRLFHDAAVEDGSMYIFGGTVDGKVRSCDIYRFKVNLIVELDNENYVTLIVCFSSIFLFLFIISRHLGYNGHPEIE